MKRKSSRVIRSRRSVRRERIILNSGLMMMKLTLIVLKMMHRGGRINAVRRRRSSAGRVGRERRGGGIGRDRRARGRRCGHIGRLAAVVIPSRARIVVIMRGREMWTRLKREQRGRGRRGRRGRHHVDANRARNIPVLVVLRLLLLNLAVMIVEMRGVIKRGCLLLRCTIRWRRCTTAAAASRR